MRRFVARSSSSSSSSTLASKDWYTDSSPPKRARTGAGDDAEVARDASETRPVASERSAADAAGRGGGGGGGGVDSEDGSVSFDGAFPRAFRRVMDESST